MAKKSTVKQLENKPAELSPAVVDRIQKWGFKKGKSGNPNGRKPGTISLSTEIKNVANQVCDQTGLTYLHTLLIVMFLESIEGNQETRQILFDRGFGTLIQKNVMMQLGGDILKLAQGMGLDANDLNGSATLRGLLQASGIDSADTFGTEANSGGEASATETTIENNSENG